MAYSAFADLHSHSFLRPFSKLEPEDSDNLPPTAIMPANPCIETSVWNMRPEKNNIISKLEKMVGFIRYSQSDFTSASYQANKQATRFICASFYAVESGFFNMNENNIPDDIIRDIPGASILVGEMITAYLGKKIKLLKTPEYNYFTDLCNQLHFFAQPSSFSADTSNCDGCDDLTDESYEIIFPGKAPSNDVKKIKVVVTIEGAHGLWDNNLKASPDAPDTEMWNGRNFENKLKNTDIQNYRPLPVDNWQEKLSPALLENARANLVELIPFNICDKIVENLKKLKNPSSLPGNITISAPCFITLAHHFYNGVCGHAESLQPLKGFLDQSFGQDSDITNLGWMLIHEMLKDADKRIIIDVKHMSRKARSSYYNYRRKYYSDVPVIWSHGAVFGGNENNGVVTVTPSGNNFYQHDINAYDEDVIEIINSGGLLGIEMDERVNGVKAGGNIMIFENIKRVVELAAKQNTTNATSWDYVCLGTDFDGIINPVEEYNTYQKMSDIYDYLTAYVTDYLATKPALRPNDLKLGVDIIVNKIMFQNVYDFLNKYYFKINTANLNA